MIDRFTTYARRALVRARLEAVERRQPAIGPEHILLAVLAVPDASAAVILRRHGLDPSDVVCTLEVKMPPANADAGTVIGQIAFRPAAKRVLEAALLEANALKHHAIRTAHLLLGILRETEGIAGHAVRDIGLGLEAAREIMRCLEEAEPDAPRTAPRYEGRTLAFARDLVKAARLDWLEPVVGRELEIRRCAHVLARAGNTGVLLVGEPGVGKSAVVEALAHRVVDGTYPGIASIWRVDVPSMLTGRINRGVLEGRIDQLISASRGRPECVLVVDDLHRVVEAGSDIASGWWDRLRWMLKPAIERGEVGMIGVADQSAMKQIHERDPAFWACFQTVIVNTPSPEETEAILAAHAPRLMDYHGLEITDGVLAAAVELAGRFLANVGAPRAALEVLDLAMARQRLGDKGMVDVEAVIEALSEMTGIDEERIR
jgi:ATP-dependent Clp protease ATP-binding subunit ClpC